MDRPKSPALNIINKIRESRNLEPMTQTELQRSGGAVLSGTKSSPPTESSPPTKTYEHTITTSQMQEQRKKDIIDLGPGRSSVTSADIISDRTKTRKGYQRYISDIDKYRSSIDPTSQYELTGDIKDVGTKGDVVSGTVLRDYYTKQQITASSDFVTFIKSTQDSPVKSGTYIKQDDQYYYTTPELRYTLRYADPKEREALLGSLSDEKKFEKSYGLAYESFTPSEKETYGYRFTDWSKVKPEEIQHYPGGERYIKSLSLEKQEELVTEYMGSKEWENYLGSSKGQKERQAVVSSMHEEKVTEPGTLIPGWFNPLGGDIKQTQWMADLNVSAVAVYDYPAAEKSIATKQVISGDTVYSDLGFRTRMGYSAAEAMLSASLYPVTLAQIGVKYVTGEGKLTDPLARIKTGKTFAPDVARVLAEDKITPTKGVVTGGIETIITKGDSDYLSTVKKYPWESGAASMGEFMGLYLGGKAIHIGKTTITKAGQKLGIPSFPMRYNPVQILRKGYWRRKGKLGLAEEIAPEIRFKESALPSGLSFAPGKTPSQRISATIKAFEKTKVLSGTDDYIGIHTTERAWFKPFVWMKKGRESPGVSFAPVGKGSPRFLRATGDVTPSYSTTGFTLFSKVKMPTAPLLFFKKIKKIPSYLQDKSYKVTGQYIKKEGGVFVAPKMYKSGGEYELVARGFARRMGVDQFTTIKGVVVPFPKFRMIEKGGMTITEYVSTKIPSNLKSFLSPVSYTSKSSISILSPSYLASIYGSSYKPSKPSYPSSISSPSYSISSMYSGTSKPSYSYVSTPSYPSKPSTPSFPSAPSIPSYPSHPSQPSIPSYPSYPSAPSTPSYPSPPPVIIPPFYSNYLTGKKDKKMKTKLGGTRYRYREFKMLGITKLLGDIKI